MDLRPLSLGEQLDRAVTFCVRNGLILSLISLAFSVPAAILRFYGTNDQSKLFEELGDMLRSHNPTDPIALQALFTRQPVFNGFTFALIGFYLFAYPLAQASLTVAMTRLYLGSQASFADSYQGGLRFFIRLVGINIAYFLFALLFYGVVLLGALAGAFVLALLTVASHWAGVLFGFLGVLAFAVFSVLGTLLLWASLHLSYFACVAERVGVIEAFTKGVERACSLPNIRRSSAAVLAIAAIYLGLVVVNGAGAAMLEGGLRNEVAGEGFAALIEVAAGIFVTAFFCVFYYDVRIRREGFDLRQEIETAPEQAIP